MTRSKITFAGLAGGTLLALLVGPALADDACVRLSGWGGADNEGTAIEISKTNLNGAAEQWALGRAWKFASKMNTDCDKIGGEVQCWAKAKACLKAAE